MFQFTVSDLQTSSSGVRGSPTLLCTPLMGTTVDQMLVEMKKAKEIGADLVGIGLDRLRHFEPQRDLDILIKQSPLPTLVSYRHGTPDRTEPLPFHYSSSYLVSNFEGSFFMVQSSSLLDSFFNLNHWLWAIGLNCWKVREQHWSWHSDGHFRPVREGGKYEGDEANRLDAFRLAMQLGANYVDVELEVA